VLHCSLRVPPTDKCRQSGVCAAIFRSELWLVQSYSMLIDRDRVTTYIPGRRYAGAVWTTLLRSEDWKFGTIYINQMERLMHSEARQSVLC
jgi:hypothetical protein